MGGCACTVMSVLSLSVRETENLPVLEILQRAAFAFVCGKGPLDGQSRLEARPHVCLSP